MVRAMGLFSKKMKDPVRGTAQVVAASMPPQGASGWSNCDLDLVVSAEGLEPYAVEMSPWTRMSKWPYPGYTLPVTVDRADPDHVKIEWDDVLSGDELASAEAERIAEAMRTRTAASDDTDGIPPEAAEIVQQLTGMFPGASVTVNEPMELARGGRTPTTSPSSSGWRSSASRARSRKSEFQAEKARFSARVRPERAGRAGRGSTVPVRSRRR